MMKLVLFYSPSFWFKTFQKVLEQVEDQDVEANCQDAVNFRFEISNSVWEEKPHATQCTDCCRWQS